MRESDHLWEDEGVEPDYRPIPCEIRSRFFAAAPFSTGLITALLGREGKELGQSEPFVLGTS